MKLNRKILSCLLAAAMSLSLLTAGCSSTTTQETTTKATDATTAAATTAASSETTSGTTAAKEQITLKMEEFSSSGGNEKTLAAMIAAFEKQYPYIKVDLQTIGYDDYFTQLQTKVSGGNTADLFELNYENFVAYASAGALYDLKDAISSTKVDLSGFYKTAIDAYQYKGDQYAIPDSFSNVVLVYNKDLFDKAGIAYPTNDWTWDDIATAGKAIRALGDDTFGFYRPITFNEFFKASAQNGGSLISADGTKFTIDTPENVKALTGMLDLVNGSNVQPTQEQLGGMGDWDLFESGRLGMIATGIWCFGTFKDACDFNWDISVEPGNTQKATHFFSNAYAVSANCTHPEEALLLAQFLAGSKEATSLRVGASWELPPVTYEDVTAAYLSQKDPANRQAVFDSLAYLITPPVVKQNAELQEIINSYLNKAIAGDLSAADALKQCQAECETKITLG
ncbi:MAG: sugar ABC transporter substrate-binding protein [Eubacteriales bacterium]